MHASDILIIAVQGTASLASAELGPADICNADYWPHHTPVKVGQWPQPGQHRPPLGQDMHWGKLGVKEQTLLNFGHLSFS